MNANEFTFGIEFETIIPVETPIRIGSYHAGIPLGLPGIENWTAENDSSIHPDLADARTHRGCEFVSPVLRGAEGLRQVEKFLTWAKSIGAKVNKSTGCHIHVGWNGDEKALARLAHLVSNHEIGFYASTGTKARETSCYAKRIRTSAAAASRFSQGQARGDDRYLILNVTPTTRSPGKRTVEFRCFAGTLNLAKAIGYIRLCVGVVQKTHAMKRKPKWTPKTPVESSPIHRSGEGQTELTRLFYALGWTKGRECFTYGYVGDELGLATIDDNKKTLMQLARKYDGRN